MPIWKREAARRKSEFDLARDVLAPRAFDDVPPGFREPLGAMPCSHQDCPRQNAAPCDYVDRRGRGCPSALCAEHRVLLGGHAYCAVHAQTLHAIGPDVPESGRPDLDNMAPPLVSWVFRDLHDRVSALLDKVTDYQAGESMAVDDGVRLIRSAADGSRRWVQGWRIVEPKGFGLAITVEVAEQSSEEVRISVAGTPVAQGIPRWLSTPSTAESDAERQTFYDGLYVAVVEGVHAERMAGPRGRL